MMTSMPCWTFSSTPCTSRASSDSVMRTVLMYWIIPCSPLRCLPPSDRNVPQWQPVQPGPVSLDETAFRCRFETDFPARYLVKVVRRHGGVAGGQHPDA